jgi:isocitrate lyase
MLEAIKETYSAQKLAQMRDELKLKIHLAKADAQDEWRILEAKWLHLLGKLDRIEGVTADAAGDVGKAVHKLLEELSEGYDRLRDSL